jgi:hypothetical protein
MNRKSVCLVVVASVVVLSLTLLPTAEARELSGSRTTVTIAASADAGWWSAAAAWMADLLHLGMTNPAPGLTHSAGAVRTQPPTLPPATKTLDNGLCIDPNGGTSCSG